MKLYKIEHLKNGEWESIIEHPDMILPGVTINFALGFLEGLSFAKKFLTEKNNSVTDLVTKNFRVVEAETDSEY